MAILFTGGAGYIGSHCFYEFTDNQQDVVVVDNLSTGHRKALPKDIKFYQGSVGDKNLLMKIFNEHNIDCVVHFAGSLLVEESVNNPEKYYHNNVVNSLNLLNCMHKAGVHQIIFSSTASVYGSHPKQIFDEQDPTSPESPYAQSKLVVENIIKDFAKAHDFKFIILRYFNVAGVDHDLRTGIYNENSTHLVKVACEVATGKREQLAIFGTDYETRDGTCIRDYIHVSDLANAHYLAYKNISSGSKNNQIYNCGYGTGHSVKEIVNAIEKCTQKKLNCVESDRRPGDPVAVIASSQKIKDQLNWSPQLENIETIINSVLSWESFNQ